MTELKINGKVYQVNAEEDTPLLWAIRDSIGLTGTKYGCGIQQCGACTVLIKGRAVRSCGVTIGEVAGSEITTIEGLSPESHHPVQLAWIELNRYLSAATASPDKSWRQYHFWNASQIPLTRTLTGACSTSAAAVPIHGVRKAIHRAAEMLKEVS